MENLKTVDYSFLLIPKCNIILTVIKMENNLKQPVFYNYDAPCFNVHGLPFYAIEHSLSRLPNGISVSKTVDFLKLHPSGAYLSFATDSSFIRVKAGVSSKAYMAHMTATGTIGCDLYIRKGQKWLFLGTTKADSENYEINIVEGLPHKLNEYRLYLPLYIHLKQLEIGIEANCTIQATEPINQDKIVFYGTSITQGGCASRPGMNSTSILGRTLNYEVINMGFSGSAHLETEMARVISSFSNIKLLVLEVEANAGETLVLKDRLETFVKIITNAHPMMKVIIISHYPYALANYKPSFRNRFLDHYRFQKQLCQNNNWEFVDGEALLKKLNYEETVDGVHLTDLGFYFLAKGLKTRINKLLK